ncbi:unnamed protein product [Sphagnum jensenii]|uniref:Uncharacterized protein n=1 Tax=Sphagnum jensenii TaxID=128206 RepID=A0ABP0VBQ1_9BRYO
MVGFSFAQDGFCFTQLEQWNNNQLHGRYDQQYTCSNGVLTQSDFDDDYRSSVQNRCYNSDSVTTYNITDNFNKPLCTENNATVGVLSSVAMNGFRTEEFGTTDDQHPAVVGLLYQQLYCYVVDSYSSTVPPTEGPTSSSLNPSTFPTSSPSLMPSKSPVEPSATPTRLPYSAPTSIPMAIPTKFSPAISSHSPFPSTKPTSLVPSITPTNTVISTNYTISKGAISGIVVGGVFALLLLTVIIGYYVYYGISGKKSDLKRSTHNDVELCKIYFTR